MGNPVDPKYFTNLIDIINNIPECSVDVPDPIGDPGGFQKHVDEIAASMSSVSETFENMFNELNEDVCRQIQSLLKLITVPGLNFTEIVDYIKSLAEFFLKPYTDLLGVQAQIILEAPLVLAALSDKIQTLQLCFCDNPDLPDFEFPVIKTPTITFGCDLDLEVPEPPVIPPVSELPSPPSIGTLSVTPPTCAV
tara:strand:+ start:311 stop:892 length:582 start_codon:yes stop_codon:yes gene_type:complete